MRLTRRGRAVLVVVVAVVALGVFWLGTRAAGAVSAWRVPGAAGVPYITVGEGDTLEEIADALSPQPDTGPMVRKIMNLNGLPDTRIRPGARLYLPGLHTAR
ncbi:LysM peptidoglycan-binding domain-containing protein [Spongiactinospora sp. TRM90649]|uniref:LysM peptidoglycan-binding domain-containing protein n=1 Tax=Spongiactinospora sp. TRM90649 TaxID=3031114 RepID=UPI0023F99D4E|nr:LysM peptidoglycan-binding domain-containing protein [Spongiactinospora sp. TRM90649]MDF5755344.1 LysM peptidoglycan-binding domain-containing protein [Spongiactinospora sp. TRM90649]